MRLKKGFCWLCGAPSAGGAGGGAAAAGSGAALALMAGAAAAAVSGGAVGSMRAACRLGGRSVFRLNSRLPVMRVACGEAA